MKKSCLTKVYPTIDRLYTSQVVGRISSSINIVHFWVKYRAFGDWKSSNLSGIREGQQISWEKNPSLGAKAYCFRVLKLKQLRETPRFDDCELRFDVWVGTVGTVISFGNHRILASFCCMDQ